MNKPEVNEAIAKLVNLVRFEGYTPSSDEITLKIDLLERLLELARLYRRNTKNNVPFEDFLQGHVMTWPTGLRFVAPREKNWYRSGTAPIRLQPKLLLFLLLHHRDRFRIYNIIEAFIQKIWEELEPLDFKRTETGVMRCFTSTRFAANTLRAYGLLKFTQEEAYKTWVLSLPGLLVAATVLEERNWHIPECQKERAASDLHPDIRSAWNHYQTFDKFVEKLKGICTPEAEVFETFDEVLKNSHLLLAQYWKTLQNDSLSNKEQKDESIRKLRELEQQPGMEEFYKQFSDCLNIKCLLESVEDTATGSGPSAEG